MLDRRFDEHRLAARQHDDIGIAYPIGSRDDDFISRIYRRQQGIEKNLLSAGSHRDLRDLVVELVLALELVDDRLLELRDTIDIGVLRLAFADRHDRRFLDVVGRVEIGFAR